MILAPLEGYTTSNVRLFFRNFGADAVFSEMISAKALLSYNRKTLKRLRFQNEERPIGIQIFGNKKETLIDAARLLEDEFNPDFIDINMGCPAKKIVKTGSGAALLKEPENTLKMIEGIVNAVKTNITVKTRIGFDKPLNRDFFISLKNTGVKFITIHGRLAKDFFSTPVNWDYIFEIASYGIPVVGNGDIFTPLDAENILKKNIVNDIMIGRGAIRDPYIFMKIRKEEVKIPERKEHYFLNFLIESGEDFITIKKFSYHIFRERNNVKRIRDMINRSKNINDLLKICEFWEENVYDRTY